MIPKPIYSAVPIEEGIPILSPKPEKRVVSLREAIRIAKGGALSDSERARVYTERYLSKPENLDRKRALDRAYRKAHPSKGWRHREH